MCSGPGELLHVDFTSIEETVPLREEPVIRNVMVMQDHFSKYVVAYVVKDQTACTAAETLRNGYFGLFGAPAYLVSDQGEGLYRPLNFKPLQTVWGTEAPNFALPRSD